MIVITSLITSLLAAFNALHYVQRGTAAADLLMVVFSGIATSQALNCVVLLAEPSQFAWLYAGSVGLMFAGTAGTWGNVVRQSLSQARK